MNEFTVDLKNADGSVKRTVNVKARNWAHALDEAAALDVWAWGGRVTHMDGKVFEEKYYI